MNFSTTDIAQIGRRRNNFRQQRLFCLNQSYLFVEQYHICIELFEKPYYNKSKIEARKTGFSGYMEAKFMKISTTSQRLKQLMQKRRLKQIDILNMSRPYCEKSGIKLSKNDLSQYVNGKVEPRQEKLYILGSALNVDEAWLLGYDVPMERKNFSSREARKDFLLIEKFSLLEEKDQKLILSLIDSLLEKAGH